MKYSTIETMPGYEITDVLGVVTGNVVQSKHVGRDIMANLKSIVGGALKAIPKCIMKHAVYRLNECLRKPEILVLML